MKKSFLLLGCFLLISSLWAQLTLRITALPANTPPADSIYIAGNFNTWNPGNANFIVKKQADGTRQIVINPPVGNVEFKFTRGSWATVEGNAQGGQRPNRVINYTGQPKTEEISILTWEDLAGNNPQGSTAAANVIILSQNYTIPQLNRTRRVWIYLPPDYNTSNKRYPVLYMHDGQNVFDAATSFSGEWKVDEALNQLFTNGDQGIIVVAIDNGGAERLNEYSPWVNNRYGGGQGDEYIKFIVETLKPNIDATYRTKADRDNTGIMGSSMGGLISLYAAIEYQNIFSKAGIFSPAFWFAPESYAHVSAKGKQADVKIYLLAGQLEDNGSVVADINAMYNTLRNAGFKEQEVIRATHPDGQHSEWYWAREFPAAYRWLFSNATTSVKMPKWTSTITLSPNPADTMVWVKNSTALPNMQYVIYDVNGKTIQPVQPLQNGQIEVAGLPAGTYVLVFYQQNRVVESKQVIIK
ncbi:MAG: alpha/beta hydrolase-fold protein [Saprospiraceae bacterium]